MSRAVAALRARGMLAALTHADVGAQMDRLLQSQSRAPAVYCGFDPTANALHVGNLLQCVALRHFQLAGFRPVLVIGGATGLIGDPSGKSEQRVLLSEQTVAENVRALTRGMQLLLDFASPSTGAVVCNNADWHSSMSSVQWMRDVGRHFRVNAMLARESVKSRLASDAGLSFLEFSYQLFQAYDFAHLLEHHDCVAQIGGSDQWGNIVAGCELIRKTKRKDCFGITLKLLTTSTGEKYGKTAGNAVWLDRNKTSVFDFYQFFLRTDDRDVERLLKNLTFLELEDIREIMVEHQRSPETRVAQRLLADTITQSVHGSAGLQLAKDATSVLFGKDKSIQKTAREIMQMAGDAPIFRLTRGDAIGLTLVDIAKCLGITKSKAECRRLIEGGGVYLNSERVSSGSRQLAESDLIDGSIVLFRFGKRKIYIVEVTGSS